MSGGEVEAARELGVRALVSIGLPVPCPSAGRRHDPVSLFPGWVGCARCGASWDEQDDEARGKPLTCEPEPPAARAPAGSTTALWGRL